MRRYKAKKADNGWKHLKAKSPMQHLVSRTMQEHNTSFECSAHNAQFTNQTRVRRLFFSQINTIETQCQFTWHSLLAKHYLIWSYSRLGENFLYCKIQSYLERIKRVRRLFFSQINTIETQCQFTWHSLLDKHYLMWSCSRMGENFFTVKFSLILKG